MSNTTKPIDEEAYKKQLLSRQLLAVGAEAQKKYAACDVLLVGLSGLGLEIAKNLVLSGIRSLTILDDSPIEWSDLSSLFYASSSDVGKPRAPTLVSKIGELNRFVAVTAATAATSFYTNENQQQLVKDDLLKQHAIAIFVDKRTTLLVDQNNRCRELGVKMICCESRGVACSVFVDAGKDEFTVLDKNGEETVLCTVADIDGEGTVFLTDDKKHELEVGDLVYFLNLPGIHGEFLNSYIPEKKGKARTAKTSEDAAAAADEARMKMFKVARVDNPFTFTIELPLLEEVVANPLVDTCKRQSNLFSSTSSLLSNPSRNLNSSVLLMTIRNCSPKVFSTTSSAQFTKLLKKFILTTSPTLSTMSFKPRKNSTPILT
jgi:ubiquitin-activating enzyme E1